MVNGCTAVDPHGSRVLQASSLDGSAFFYTDLIWHLAGSNCVYNSYCSLGVFATSRCYTILKQTGLSHTLQGIINVSGFIDSFSSGHLNSLGTFFITHSIV